MKAVYSLQQLSTCRDILDRLRGKRLDGRVETRPACERREQGRGQRAASGLQTDQGNFGVLGGVRQGLQAATFRGVESWRRIGGKIDRWETTDG